MTAEAETRSAAEAVARASYGKLVAFLSARTRDVAAAEDALGEAFAQALAHWPRDGVPQRPEAWLMTAARRRLIDAARRRSRAAEAEPALRLMTDELAEFAEEGRAVPDERLSLMFACAHPAIDPAVRAPLILQAVLGLDAVAIAGAFLVAPATMGQRLVRAKAKIKQAGIAFRSPERAELPERLEAVLDAVYAAFASGWSEPTLGEPARDNLTVEAIFLGRLVCRLLPQEPEALGLLALMLHVEARRRARRSIEGAYVPLSEQDPAAWDGALIQEAEAALRQASQCGVIGRYQLEAAVQSAHAARRLTGRVHWPAIVQLYDGLAAISASPVVRINRAVALAEVEGAQAGLANLEALAADPRLAGYQPWWAARAGLLVKAGRSAEAVPAFERAIGLESDPAVRRFLQERLAASKAGDA